VLAAVILAANVLPATVRLAVYVACALFGHTKVGVRRAFNVYVAAVHYTGQKNRYQ
jgi:hypothetical protein